MSKNNKPSLYTLIILVISFLLPVFVLPNINNPLLNSKGLLLFLLAFITVLAYLLQSFKDKKWLISLNPLLLPSIIFAISILLSTLINHRYPFDQLVSWGGFFLSAVAIIIFAPVLIKKDYSHKFLQVLNVAGLILVLGSVLQLFGLGYGQLLDRISALQFPNDLSFSLTGGVLLNIQLLSTLVIANLLDKNKEQGGLKKLISAILIMGLGINLYSLLPGREAQLQLLPLSASLSITRDSLAMTNRALFGFGPASYTQAFHILKPIWLNTTDLWQLSFESATAFPLTIIVSGGLLAFLSWAFLAIRSLVLVNKKDDKETAKASGLKYFIITAIIWQIISPLNILTLSLLALAIAFYLAANLGAYKIKKLSFQNIFDPYNLQPKNKASIYTFSTISVLIMAIVLYSAYQVGRNYAAHFVSYQAIAATVDEDMALTFTKQEQARNIANHSAAWRRDYAISSLEIAIAMSNKTDITPAEQEQVLNLVNTAITEAKAATVLQPKFYQNWLILAEVYLQLLDVTEDAAQLAFDALAQATLTNPNDPTIRITLGQFFSRLGQWQYAITFFTQAIERKPDLAVAHYSLAQAYKANGQILEAESSFQQALLLIDKDSNLEDYTAVERELAQIKQEANALRGETGETGEMEIYEEEEANRLLELMREQSSEEATSPGLINVLDEEETSSILREERLVSEEETIN